MTNKLPAYLELLASGELEKRVIVAKSHLSACDVCPAACGVDRTAGALGVCKTGEFAQVSSYFAHHGEERPISGRRGSGTIFFTRCNLRCVYCQNANISQLTFGEEVTAEDLAGIMLSLQKRGCHNVNLVSPSHVVPQIIEAVYVAARKGLILPLVYNTGGFDSLEMLALLDRVVDIYMPDMKYGDEEIARKYSLVKNYPQINQAAVLEMHRQVGDLKLDDTGIAYRGLLIRHLVLPDDLSRSESIFRFLAEKVSENTYVNIMAQYHPAFHAWDYPKLNRRITPGEYSRVRQVAQQCKLNRIDK